MASHERSALATNLGVLQGTASNSSHLSPTPKDLALALPRLILRFANVLTDGLSIAKTVVRAGYNATGNATSAGLLGATGSMASDASETSSFFSAFSLQQIRTFGGIFSYLTSKWALGCFAAAIILNRTTIYAASRRYLHLGWKIRLALRLAPLVVLASLSLSISRTLRCQTSPTYSLMKTGNSGSVGVLDFAEDGGALYWLSSTLLFWETERSSCLAVDMIPSDTNPERIQGSMALMWMAFLAFNLSQFVETLSCAVQALTLSTEKGRTRF